jgi:hypothetical protein
VTTYRNELAHVVTPKAHGEDRRDAHKRRRHTAVQTGELIPTRCSIRNLAWPDDSICTTTAARTPSRATSLRAQSMAPVYIGGWPGLGFSMVWRLTLIRSMGWPVATRHTPTTCTSRSSASTPTARIPWAVGSYHVPPKPPVMNDMRPEGAARAKQNTKGSKRSRQLLLIHPTQWGAPRTLFSFLGGHDGKTGNVR